MIRDKIHIATYSKHVGCDIGFEGSGWNIFFESIRVYFSRVGVGGSVCFRENVGVMASRELCFWEFC